MMSEHSDSVITADIKVVADMATDTWRRVPPAAIIYYVIKIISGILRGGLTTIAPVAAVVAAGGENRWLVLSVLAIGGGAALLVGAILSYLNFKFRMEGSKFLIRSGVFKKKRLTLSFDRIQNVALMEPIYFRPLGLVVLTLESAGSKTEEVHLAGIARPVAQKIRRHVLDWKSQHKNKVEDNSEVTGAGDAITETPPNVESLLRQPIPELVKYGLSNNNIFVFAGAIAVITSQVDKFWQTRFLEELFDTVGHTVGTSIIAIAALILAGIIVAISLLVAASVLGAIIANYKYHLSYSDQKYHRSRGLLNREETSVPEVKIQSVRIWQPLIARFLNRFHMTFQQVGFANKDGQKTKQNFIIPSVQADFYRKLAKRLFPGSSVLDLPLQSISKRFITRHSVYSVGIISSTMAGILAFPLGWIATALLFAPALFLPVIVLRRQRYGYATDGRHGIVRSGLLGHRLTIFPFYKVQSMEIRQSPGQRKHGLADIKIKLAGRSLTVPYIPIKDAVDWRNIALRNVETSTAHWM